MSWHTGGEWMIGAVDRPPSPDDDGDPRGDVWRVYCVEIGCRATGGLTRADAIAKARELLAMYTPQTIRAAIAWLPKECRS